MKRPFISSLIVPDLTHPIKPIERKMKNEKRNKNSDGGADYLEVSRVGVTGRNGRIFSNAAMQLGRAVFGCGRVAHCFSNYDIVVINIYASRLARLDDPSCSTF